ncbi:hypothetical protein EVAR_4966_1 [Eumeta japonica]|uniref:Uncharacterized protein n=1 Tax=Eumeta variegata TaxID=151549 RepID=A0A4C1UZQ4_EUMVA|nr:hypothetical protein EVAR_4966_1 [Eumeta japonica]
MVSVLQESALRIRGQNGLAYFNKDERAVKMILAGRPMTVVTEKMFENRKIKNQCALGTKMLTPFDKQRRLQTRVHAMDEKAAEEIQGSKVGIEAYGDNFWDSEGTRGSCTETWEVIARSAVLQDNASVHTVRVSRQALKDTGFSEIDHPTAQI